MQSFELERAEVNIPDSIIDSRAEVRWTNVRRLLIERLVQTLGVKLFAKAIKLLLLYRQRTTAGRVGLRLERLNLCSLIYRLRLIPGLGTALWRGRERGTAVTDILD